LSDLTRNIEREAKGLRKVVTSSNLLVTCNKQTPI